jgi:serine protease Do
MLWMRRIVWLLAFAAEFFVAPPLFTTIAFAQDAAEAIPPNLRRSLDGGAPSSAADLRAMQAHVRKLADRVKKSTVGIQCRAAWGSGVIVSKDGYVLTAAHITAQPGRECTLTLADGREVKGRTLGLFRTLDAGLVKITEPGEYPHVELGNSSQLKVGQWCMALGHPNGYQTERGAVVRLGRVLLAAENAITTDCTLVLGDYGGPLLDMDGRVIGVNSRIAELLSTNMHVPVDVYRDPAAWDRMLKGEAWGYLLGQQPWLGVGGDPESKEAKIASVKSGSPAERQGLKPGDVILAVDGREVADFPALTRAIDDCNLNESVKLKLRRGEQVVEFHIRLARKPE